MTQKLKNVTSKKTNDYLCWQNIADYRLTFFTNHNLNIGSLKYTSPFVISIISLFSNDFFIRCTLVEES